MPRGTFSNENLCFFSSTGVAGISDSHRNDEDSQVPLAAASSSVAQGKPRNSKLELRNPEPEIRNTKSETRKPKPETQNPKPEIRNPKPETRDPGLYTLNPAAKPVYPALIAPPRRNVSVRLPGPAVSVRLPGPRPRLF